ncbi:putative COMM domain-containing protein 5 [Monocercomonoides exilis]|uniref:putative COMM domain-containing protein 5 n=1 Tax=Monocercomonoides exilis TaxID=2049356 RepID=UPI0035596844|nr:putative COMM domain-containing protein 5 [Monocercomonoides exilis]|eukprot:MONOS_3600.1-p1 / transcript=MONOS_3600.1 / gene=MONOS_3600 / organism=Monocercomonoides_exilis_PA203 / gene_product=COMM domain-containing protein 5 / transcript_product=COMM domain-containing protein 5 / location=Mono_scaffold00086:38436-39135(-) / protein_length=213 / sequence_SO=supercontig / SO=protein_coding / is_pseudo=false
MERIPEIRKLTNLLGHITQQAQWIKLIQAVMNQHRNVKNFNADMLHSVRSETGLSEEVFNSIYTGLYCMLAQLIRDHCRKPDENLEQFVMEDLSPLGLPEKYVQIFGSAFKTYVKSLHQSARDRVPRHPSLKLFRWRTEVAISTSSLNRLLRPSILIEFTLSDKRKQLLQMDLKMFHTLRFGVACMLKEMNDIEHDPQIQRDVKILPGVTAMY